jgi:hypothetical protein
MGNILSSSFLLHGNPVLSREVTFQTKTRPKLDNLYWGLNELTKRPFSIRDLTNSLEASSVVVATAVTTT